MAELSLDFQTNLLNVLQQSLSSLSNIEKSLNKVSAGYNDINKNVSETLSTQQSQGKTLEESNKQLNTTVDKYNDINKNVQNYNKSLGIMSGLTKGFGAGLSAIAGGFAALYPTTAIVDAINMNKEYQKTFLDLSYRMGQGGKTAGTYTSAMHGITQATGIANKDSMELVKNLAQYRVAAKDVKELGITTARFSKITGVSAGESARLTGELMRTGRIGKDSTKSVLYGMTTVQRAVGLTDTEMSNLTDNIVTNTRLLNNMGKTAVEIEKFAKTTTSLSGAFVKVGLSIEDAQGMLDRFLDPTQFEENALLYAQLGYSFSDVINGVIPQEELQGRLKELSNQVEGMGVMAGVEMSKQLNIPYKQLMQMGKMDINPLGDTSKDSKNIDKNLQSMQEGQEGWGKNMEQSINRMTDRMTSAFDKLTPALTGVTNFLENFSAKIKTSTILLFAVLGIGLKLLIDKFKNGMTRASVDTSKAVGSALTMNINKSMSVLEKKRDIKIRILEEVKQQRREGTEDYKKRAAQVQFFEERTQMSQLAFTKKMLANHSEWLYQIQKGSKMTSGLDYQTQQMNKKIRERVELANRDVLISHYSNKLIIEGLKSRKEELDNRLKALGFTNLEKQALGDEIKAKEKSGEITARQTRELLMIANERSSVEEKINKKELKANNERINLQKQRDFLLRRMSGAELLAMKQNADKRMADLAAELKTQKDLRIAQQTGIDALTIAQQTNKDAIKQLQSKKTLTSAESEELIKQLDLQKKIDASLTEAKNEITLTEQKMQEINEEKQKELKNSILAQKALDKTGKAPAGFGEIMSKLPDKMKDFIKAAGSNAASAIGKIAINAKNSLVSGAQIIGSAINPSNIAAKIKTMGLKNLIFGGDYKVLGKNQEVQEKHTKGLIKTMGGLLGGIGGLAMSVGLLSFIMKPLTPVLEPIGKAIESLMQVVVQSLLPIIQKLAAALLPIFIALVNALMPKLLWALAQALKVLGFLVSTIGNLIKFMMELPDKIGMAVKTFLTGKSEKEQMADYLKEGKGFKERQEISRLLASTNLEDKKTLEEMYNKQKYAGNAVYGIADSIAKFGDTLSATGRELEKMDIVKGDKPLIDEKATKKIMETMATSITTAGQYGATTAATTGTGAAAAPGTPTTFAATKGGIKKVEEGAPSQENPAAKAAAASEKTADGVNKMNEGQGVLANIQQLTYEEMKKLNENFSKLFSKVAPATAGVTTPR